MPAQPGSASVRFIEGAPDLETLIDGVPEGIGNAYLQVNGKTVASAFNYGTLTPFVAVPSGTLSLVALDTLGYSVGPLASAALSPGKRYTLIVVGTYPTYSVLTFDEPAGNGDAALSLYEASPTVPQADFGSFAASSHSDFKQLGSASLGDVTTVTLGSRVTNFGGYVGPTSNPIGSVTPSQINSFDTDNVLPFHSADRLSLFLLDPKTGSTLGPVLSSLDQ